jgi:hypothetical protein
LHLAHNVGDTVLQLEGTRFQQCEVVWSLLKLDSVSLKFVDLLFELRWLGGLRIQRYVDQSKLLAVAQLRIGNDMPDCR